MNSNSYGMEILVNGRSVKEYPHSGETYIEGRKGSEFTVRLMNHTSRRVSAVPTVDGLSVFDGKPATPNGQGYIVEPHSAFEIPGWRLDDGKVAKFTFASPEEGYANQTGQGGNIGVIGCAFFPEKWTIGISQPIDNYHSTNPCWSGGSGGTMTFGAARSATKGGCPAPAKKSLESAGLATGFGKVAEHKVVGVAFERESAVPHSVLTIRYSDKAGLSRIGVQTEAKAVVELNPRPETANPFPRTGCTPPSGWRPRK